VVYRNDNNAETMFSSPEMVFRKGRLVLRRGELLEDCSKTVLVSEFPNRTDALTWGARGVNRQRWQKLYGYTPWLTAIGSDEFTDEGLGMEHALWHG